MIEALLEQFQILVLVALKFSSFDFSITNFLIVPEIINTLKPILKKLVILFQVFSNKLQKVDFIIILLYIGFFFIGLFGWEVNSLLLQTLITLLFILSLTSIIGWKIIGFVIENPSDLKPIMADRYIIFLTSILNHAKISERFTSFSLVLGSFIGLKIVQFWEISFPYSFFITISFSILTLLILFIGFYGIFLLALFNPINYGKWLLDFLKANASTHLLSLIGLNNNTYTERKKKFVYRKKKKKT